MAHNQLAILVVYRLLLGHLSKCPNLVTQRRRKLITTNLIIEEGIPDILRDSGYSQNIVLTPLVVLGVDAITKRVTLIFDQSEGARRESVQWWARVDPNRLLEQLGPSFMLTLIPEPVIIITP